MSYFFVDSVKDVFGLDCFFFLGARGDRAEFLLNLMTELDALNSVVVSPSFSGGFSLPVYTGQRNKTSKKKRRGNIGSARLRSI